MNLRKAAERALKYFEDAHGLEDTEVAIKEALRQALAKEEQEPVGYAHVEDLKREHHDFWVNREQGVNEAPLYTAPPKREWVGLSDEESKPLIQKAMMYYGHNPDHWTITAGAGFCILARAIEAKLKEKNT